MGCYKIVEASGFKIYVATIDLGVSAPDNESYISLLKKEAKYKIDKVAAAL